MKYLSLIFFPFLMMACDRSTSDTKFETHASPAKARTAQLLMPIETFGWMDKNCIAIKNDALLAPIDIKISRLDGSGATEKATITGKAISSEACPALLDDRKVVNTSAGYSFYSVETQSPIDLAIGQVMEGDTGDLSFSYCTTSEGISFKAERKTAQIWEGYYYLGYDTKDTCHESKR